jgi:ankyrin repeat protein
VGGLAAILSLPVGVIILYACSQTPLHLATYLNLSSVVRDLVESGASLELQDQEGNTPLHMACEQGWVECATEMIRNVSSTKLTPVLESQNWRGEKAGPVLIWLQKREKKRRETGRGYLDMSGAKQTANWLIFNRSPWAGL